MANKYTELAKQVAAAIEAGRIAAVACADDGGSANLDRVVLSDMKGAREASLREAGIDGYKLRGGYHLSTPFPGQGQRRYAGVQAMAQSLNAAGVPCYVHYQID